MIYAPSFGWRQGARRSRWLQSLTAGRCARHRKAALAPGMNGAKPKRGSKVHMAVDTLGHLLAPNVAAANFGDRPAADIRGATGDTVSLAHVDQSYSGRVAAEAAGAEGIKLEAVKLPEAKRGFVLLPRR